MYTRVVTTSTSRSEPAMAATTTPIPTGTAKCNAIRFGRRDITAKLLLHNSPGVGAKAIVTSLSDIPTYYRLLAPLTWPESSVHVYRSDIIRTPTLEALGPTCLVRPLPVPDGWHDAPHRG